MCVRTTTKSTAQLRFEHRKRGTHLIALHHSLVEGLFKVRGAIVERELRHAALQIDRKFKDVKSLLPIQVEVREASDTSRRF